MFVDDQVTSIIKLLVMQSVHGNNISQQKCKFVFLFLIETILKIERARGLKTDHLFYMAGRWKPCRIQCHWDIGTNTHTHFSVFESTVLDSSSFYRQSINLWRLSGVFILYIYDNYFCKMREGGGGKKNQVQGSNCSTMSAFKDRQTLRYVSSPCFMVGNKFGR